MRNTTRLILSLCFLALTIGSFAQTQEDIKLIKAKLFKRGIQTNSSEQFVASNDAKHLLEKLDNTGKWTDIDYLDKTDSRWKPAEHWERIGSLVAQYKNPKSNVFNDPQVKIAILNAIDWWLKVRPMCGNYWWNAIGIPGFMGGVFIMMEEELSETTKQKGIQIMNLGVKPDFYDYHGVATGQNLLWLATVHLYTSCLSNDIEGLKKVFKAVSKEIVVTNNEGVQPDYSFYQHGQQNYTFGYGKGFTTYSVQFFYLFNGTAFAFPKEKVDVIAHYLLDGQQWMSHNTYLEYTAMGREISRKGINRGGIVTALKMMEEIDPERSAEYNAFAERLNGSKAAQPLIGNRYFWRSDLMVHQRPNYYFGLKTTSNRIVSGEAGNGENIKGYYQGNGTYYLVRTNEEYKEIFPIFNWRKLPGGLIPQSLSPIPQMNWSKGARGATSFVYGISDSLYGCFAYDYNKDNTKAHRSWFMFDNEIVYLANGIEGDSLYQSINQSLLKGEVWQSGVNNQSEGNSQKVFHDNTGYCILKNNFTTEVKTDKQSGSWKDINLAAGSEKIEKKVFTLGISLGNKVTDASLAYAIVPAINLNDFKNYSLKDHITLLENSNSIQAVYQKDIQQVQAVFYSEGKIALPWSHLTIQMKKQGLVLIKKKDNKMIVDYSQPFPKKHIELMLDNQAKWSNNEISIF